MAKMVLYSCRDYANSNGQMLSDGAVVCIKGDKSSSYVVIPPALHNTRKEVHYLKRIRVKEEYSVGCGLCEVYCVVQHSKSKDLIKAYNIENPRPISRVKLEVHKPVSFAIQCRHCDDPACVTACSARLSSFKIRFNL